MLVLLWIQSLPLVRNHILTVIVDLHLEAIDIILLLNLTVWLLVVYKQYWLAQERGIHIDYHNETIYITLFVLQIYWLAY